MFTAIVRIQELGYTVAAGRAGLVTALASSILVETGFLFLYLNGPGYETLLF